MKHKLKWTLIGLGALYLIVGFFVIPFTLEKKLPEIVSEATGGSFTVGSVSFNPLIARLEINEISLEDPQGEAFFDMSQLIANVSLISLFTATVHVEDIELFEPRTTIKHNEDGSFNFDWLTQSNTQETEEMSSEDNSTSAELPRVRVDRFALVDGRASYADMTKAKPFEVGLGPVGFELKDIDTADIASSDDHIHIYTHISDGGFVDIKSDILSLDPPALNGSVVFESGALYTDWKYIQENFRLEVADGKLHLNFDFDVDMKSLDDMKIDNFQFAMERLRIKPKAANADILRMGLLAVDNATIEPLKQRVKIEGVRIDDVNIFARRDAEGIVDWQRHLAPVEMTEDENVTEGPEEVDSVTTEEANATEPWLVTLDSFSMTKIKAAFKDEGVVPNVTTTLNDLTMNAAHISSQGVTPLDYNLTMAINESMLCKSTGDIAHTPLDINALSGCEAIDLTWFRPYIDQAANAALEKYDVALTHGIIGFNAGTLIKESDSAMAIETYGTDFALRELTLRQKSDKSLLLRLNKMSIEDIQANTLVQELNIKKFVLDRPVLYARKSKEGIIDWADVIVPKAPEPVKESKVSANTEPKEVDGPAWKVGLAHFALDKGDVSFIDKSLSIPAKSRLDWIEVDVHDISSQEKSKMRYKTSMRINKKGRLYTKGALIHTPLQQSGSIHLKDLQLSDLDPYIQEGSYVSIKRGALNIKAKESYEVSSSKPDLRLTGSLSIFDFVANDTHDDSVLFAFEDITIDPYLFEYAPNKLFIEEIDMKTLYANVIIDEDKTMNFAELVKERPRSEKEVVEAPATESNTTKEEPFPYTVVKIAIDGSSTNFADFSLPLKFDTYVHDVKGTVYAISSEPKEITKVDMEGVIDRYGSAKLGGEVSSADPKHYTDMKIAFKNLALNNYSPYSAQFAGRKIDSGKLSVGLGYEIDKGALKGENSVIINKLELGDDVESEDAVSLPLGLAIALLEDSDGVIDIDMPVEGDLENPDFKYGATVWKAFSNMIIGIVASPFNFLGSMLGIEGDELKSIAFEPGELKLLPPEKEKLDTIAKALAKRPKLELGVAGTYDVKSDHHALQAAKAIALVLSEIDSEKLKKDETVAIPVIEDLVEEAYGDELLDEIQDRLHEKYEDDDAYDRHYFKEIKEKLIGLQQVTDAELSTLAAGRAKMITTYLEVETQTAPERMRLEEIQSKDDPESEYVENALSIVIND